MAIHKTTIDLDVEVHYTAHKACRGSRDSLGVPMEPDEPAWIEIETVIHDTGDLCLTQAQLETLRTEIAEALGEQEDG